MGRNTIFLFVLTVVKMFLIGTTTGQMQMQLGSRCHHDMDCTDYMKGSACSMDGICECAPYYVQYNDTTCLQSQLLGSDCVLAEQCTMKVANSSCLDGACRCVEGFLQFRKHTCLGPARPGTVCYSNAHCQMWDTQSRCDFLIPNLFGRCQCTPPAHQKGSVCVIEEEEHVAGWEKPHQVAADAVPVSEDQSNVDSEDDSVVIDVTSEKMIPSIAESSSTDDTKIQYEENSDNILVKNGEIENNSDTTQEVISNFSSNISDEQSTEGYKITESTEGVNSLMHSEETMMESDKTDDEEHIESEHVTSADQQQLIVNNEQDSEEIVNSEVHDVQEHPNNDSPVEQEEHVPDEQNPSSAEEQNVQQLEIVHTQENNYPDEVVQMNTDEEMNHAEEQDPETDEETIHEAEQNASEEPVENLSQEEVAHEEEQQIISENHNENTEEISETYEEHQSTEEKIEEFDGSEVANTKDDDDMKFSTSSTESSEQPIVESHNEEMSEVASVDQQQTSHEAQSEANEVQSSEEPQTLIEYQPNLVDEKPIPADDTSPVEEDQQTLSVEEQTNLPSELPVRELEILENIPSTDNEMPHEQQFSDEHNSAENSYMTGEQNQEQPGSSENPEEMSYHEASLSSDDEEISTEHSVPQNEEEEEFPSGENSVQEGTGEEEFQIPGNVFDHDTITVMAEDVPENEDFFNYQYQSYPTEIKATNENVNIKIHGFRGDSVNISETNQNIPGLAMQTEAPIQLPAEESEGSVVELPSKEKIPSIIKEFESVSEVTEPPVLMKEVFEASTEQHPALVVLENSSTEKEEAEQEKFTNPEELVKTTSVMPNPEEPLKAGIPSSESIKSDQNMMELVKKLESTTVMESGDTLEVTTTNIILEVQEMKTDTPIEDEAKNQENVKESTTLMPSYGADMVTLPIGSDKNEFAEEITEIAEKNTSTEKPDIISDGQYLQNIFEQQAEQMMTTKQPAIQNELAKEEDVSVGPMVNSKEMYATELPESMEIDAENEDTTESPEIEQDEFEITTQARDLNDEAINANDEIVTVKQNEDITELPENIDISINPENEKLKQNGSFISETLKPELPMTSAPELYETTNSKEFDSTLAPVIEEMGKYAPIEEQNKIILQDLENSYQKQEIPAENLRKDEENKEALMEMTTIGLLLEDISKKKEAESEMPVEIQPTTILVQDMEETTIPTPAFDSESPDNVVVPDEVSTLLPIIPLEETTTTQMMPEKSTVVDEQDVEITTNYPIYVESSSTLNPINEVSLSITDDSFAAESVASPVFISTSTELPFDIPSDPPRVAPQADNLIVEAFTEQTLAPLVEVTTLANLASRATEMEPNAPITTSLPFLDTATTMSSIITDAVVTKNQLEIRKRVDLGDGPVSIGLSCANDKQCQLADPYTFCNSLGKCDCAIQSNDANTCRAEKPGCSQGTFQCRSTGVCISWFFVCDGRPDCSDASDEQCTHNPKMNQTCPNESFRCIRSGKCVSRASLCDGKKQCPHGEDEMGCSSQKTGRCPEHTFRCKSGECLPEYEFCNAIISCKDGSDEPPHLCGSRSVPKFLKRLLNASGAVARANNHNSYCPLRCGNGRCRSTAIICSGRDGCGDGSDEETCSVCRCPAPIYDQSKQLRAIYSPLWRNL